MSWSSQVFGLWEERVSLGSLGAPAALLTPNWTLALRDGGASSFLNSAWCLVTQSGGGHDRNTNGERSRLAPPVQALCWGILPRSNVRQESASRCHHLAMLVPATAGGNGRTSCLRRDPEARFSQSRGSLGLQPGTPFREPHQTLDLPGAGVSLG